MVAARRGKLVGALTITRHGDPAAGHWVIFGLEVKAHLRGLGIGERIVREAVDKARAAGARHIGLFVRKSSKPALALYRKLGFAESDDHPSAFNRAPDELYMARVYAPEA